MTPSALTPPALNGHLLTSFMAQPHKSWPI